jgi:hypothetical protein
MSRTTSGHRGEAELTARAFTCEADPGFRAAPISPERTFTCGDLGGDISPLRGGSTRDFGGAGPPNEFCLLGPPIELCGSAGSVDRMMIVAQMIDGMQNSRVIRLSFIAAP